MSVIFTRIGTPFPGKQAEAFEYAKARKDAINSLYGTKAEVHVRMGGPLGQIAMVSYHETVQEVEDIKRKVIGDSTSGKIPASPGNLFSSVEDAIWLTK